MNAQKPSRLEQKDHFLGTQLFEICADGCLQTTSKSRSAERQFKVSLKEINPEPGRVKVSATKFVPGVVIAGFCAVLITIAAILQKHTEERITVAFFAFFMWIVLYAAVRKFKLNSVNVLAFYSRFTGQAVAILWFERPNKDEFDAFVSELRRNLSQTPATALRGASQSISGEILELKKLLDAGAISQEEFGLAKAKLLTTDSSNSGERFLAN